MKSNQAIREKAKQKNVLLWEIARELNIADSNFSRKLRNELPLDEQTKILAIIDDIAKNKTASAE